MLKNYFFIFTLLSTLTLCAQVNYSGNGNSGFGGVIGTSTLEINDDGTTITFTLTKGAGDFNDAFVVYISTGTTGRTVIDGSVNDAEDDLRRAISNSDASNATTINFPSGFEATRAIALNTSFGGIWEIPSSGTIEDGGLPFVATANSSLSSTGDAIITFSATWAQLGLTSSDSFDFVGIYLNAGNAFTSNEGYGEGIPSENPGAGTITYTSAETYGDVLSTPEISTNSIKVSTHNKQLTINGLSSKADISIFNLLGQNVINKSIIANDGVDLSSQATGIYIIKIRTENITKTYKMVLD